MPLAVEVWILTTGPPGKSLQFLFQTFDFGHASHLLGQEPTVTTASHTHLTVDKAGLYIFSLF